MHFVLFTHSLVSDWNHGNAHFQRGILRELIARGHTALAYEPAEGWSRAHLVGERGPAPIERFHHDFPELVSRTYPTGAPVEAMLEGADVVIVHEWNEPALIAAIGRHRRAGGRFALLFHDTHHRAVSAPNDLAALDLDGYDAVLAFGEVLSETYRRLGWGRRVFTWHEGADARLFKPMEAIERRRDLVWIGNWGDGERGAELSEFVVEPVRRLGLAASAYGVRYPNDARAALGRAGMIHRGWLANADVPAVLAAHRASVHVPRRPYVQRLAGIPTIRMFEALACGAALVCARWQDTEGLFRAGEDYLTAANGEAMEAELRRILEDEALAQALRRSGRERILSRHTCAHRVDELFAILAHIAAPAPAPEPAR